MPIILNETQSYFCINLSDDPIISVPKIENMENVSCFGTKISEVAIGTSQVLFLKKLVF